jgi:hypothetical protein
MGNSVVIIGVVVVSIPMSTPGASVTSPSFLEESIIPLIAKYKLTKNNIIPKIKRGFSFIGIYY